jgi:MFS transporter, DHA2 family, multidrug resistance protein
MPAVAIDIGARTVGDIMQHDVAAIFADAPVSEVARLLWDQQVGGAPVVDAVGRPIGFISASDVVRYKAYGVRYVPPRHNGDPAALAEYELTEPLPPLAPGRAGEPVARQLMTPATISVRPETTVPELARFLVNAGIHRALVMDHGQLLGIVSVSDIVEEVARSAPAGL